jgi:predicted nucleic acid-binding protein
VTTLYAESSAVLEWLLGTERGASVRTALAAAPGVIASELTTAEVARTLRRLTATGQLTPEQRAESYGLYLAAAAHWTFWAVDNGILSRAGEAFGVEPVRTLDAIHLATAAAFSAEVEAVVVCSLDHRVRLNAKALGLDVSPADC